MRKQIFSIIAEILQMEDKALQENYDSRDVWDSIQRVEILFAIEDEFGILFNESELMELTTPQKLSEAVMRRTIQK